MAGGCNNKVRLLPSQFAAADDAHALPPPLQACVGSAIQSAWRCPHLTSLLFCSTNNIAVADGTPVQCTGLRQLQFDGCTFGRGFPEQLCSALSQLSSLAIRSTRVCLDGLPPAFSWLRCACFAATLAGTLHDACWGPELLSSSCLANAGRL